jgi:hypothetical protein
MLAATSWAVSYGNHHFSHVEEIGNGTKSSLTYRGSFAMASLAATYLQLSYCASGSLLDLLKGRHVHEHISAPEGECFLA